MELRQIWAVVVRRWWLILIPPLIVAALSLRSWQTLLSPPVSYGMSARFIVGEPPLDATTGFDPRYYSWLTSEYVANGLEEWVRGRGYAERVTQDLAQRHNVQMPPEQFQGAVAADSDRSVVVLYLTQGTSGNLPAMMDSAVRVLSEQNADAFPQLGKQLAGVTVLAVSGVAANAPGLRDRLDLPLRVGLGLLAGLALAFFVDYLDPTVRNRGEVESAGWEVLGTIPGKRRWPR